MYYLVSIDLGFVGISKHLVFSSFYGSGAPGTISDRSGLRVLFSAPELDPGPVLSMFHKQNFVRACICDFKMASISCITESSIHCTGPGRVLADLSR